jgi:hypothetical protein
MTATSTRHDWKSLAKSLAEKASNECFESRRGIWHLGEVLGLIDAEALCIYNNNPYAAGPQYRSREVAKFRKWLRSQGIKELACEYFGDDDRPDYTFAMLIDVGDDRTNDVVDVWQNIVAETMASMPR